MATTLTLTHPLINSGLPVRVLGGRLTISGKKNVVATPNAYLNGTQAEVQTESVENLKYVVNGVYFTNESGVLTYPMLLELYRRRYGGSGVTGADQAIVLTATYGRPGSTSNLVSFDGTTTDIDVILESFTFIIDMKDTKDGYIPSCTITFVETA